MTSLGVAIAIHALSVVWWIGGLAFVTAVILPGLRPGRDGGGEPRVWRRMHRLHVLLLVIALIIIGGAVAGSHGF